MSYLVNFVPSPAPVLDPRLRGRIVFCSDAQIPQEINLALSLVLVAVADQLEKENRLCCDTPITGIFSNSDSVTIALNEPEQAFCMRIIFYPLSRLCRLGANQLLTSLAEELCHLIWDIPDETLVNFKVLEVLRNLRPQFSLADLYSAAEVEACAQYAQEHPNLPLSELLPG